MNDAETFKDYENRGETVLVSEGGVHAFATAHPG
jgi:hypothetical protein